MSVTITDTSGVEVVPVIASPSFGDSTVADQTYDADSAISALTLPVASGGDGTLTYSLSPRVPGLTFNASTRRLTGTPSSAGTYNMTYTVTDADRDSATLNFVVTVAIKQITTSTAAPPAPPVPTGLVVSGTGQNFIAWRWNPVEGASGYDVQFSATEAFTDDDEALALTAKQTSYLRDDLEAETSYFLRVRSATGTGTGRLTSTWAMLVAGRTTAPPAPREMPKVPLHATRSRLERLFDEIIDKTERREAFSAVKEQAMSFSALADMKVLRSEFIASTTEAELYYALVKLSNARRDRHLWVPAVEGGLDHPGLEWLRAPIAVLPDYSDIDNPSFFVAAVAPGVSSPEPGDRIVAINGRTIAEYVEEFTSWIGHSTLHGLYWTMARHLPWLAPYAPPESVFAIAGARPRDFRRKPLRSVTRVRRPMANCSGTRISGVRLHRGAREFSTLPEPESAARPVAVAALRALFSD